MIELNAPNIPEENGAIGATGAEETLVYGMPGYGTGLLFVTAKNLNFFPKIAYVKELEEMILDAVTSQFPLSFHLRSMTVDLWAWLHVQLISGGPDSDLGKLYLQRGERSAALGIPDFNGLLIVLAAADNHRLLRMPMHAFNICSMPWSSD